VEDFRILRVGLSALRNVSALIGHLQITVDNIP